MGEVRVTSINKNDRFNPHQRIPATYPPEAVLARVEDVVIVEFTVGADGRVADTRIVRSNPLLDEAALAAVRRWEFCSPECYGASLSETQTVAIHFTLS